MRIHPILAAALLVAACGEPEPPAPPVLLSAGADTIHVDIRQDAEGAWVGGQRFVVLSPDDQRVALLDFSAQSATRLDAGDRLQHPVRLFALADTFFLSDWGTGRVTAWTADGKFVRDMPLLDGGVLPADIDAQGRLYGKLSPNPGPDGSGNRDSSAVVRFDSPSARPDTVAQLTPLDLAKVITDQGTRFDRRIFSGEDYWGVLPDGSVWVARHYHNRVDWRDTTGDWHKGRPLMDRILQVTETDRERFIASFPPDLQRTAGLLQFAPIKPPFVGAFASSDGHVFLEKSRHISDTMQMYHEVGRDGKFIRAIQLHGWSKLLAASPTQLLISTPDSAGGFTMGVVDRVDGMGGTDRTGG